MSCLLLSHLQRIRGRFLDIEKTVAQAREIHDQVRYFEDGLLIT